VNAAEDARSRRGSAVNADDAPIFVVGSGRSGTTLLRLMMNAHPRIYLTHEAAFYLTPEYYSTDASGEEWLEWYFDSFLFAWLQIHPDLVRSQLPAELPRSALPDIYRAIMRAKAAQYGRPRYGDKTPWHAVHLGKVFRDFPGAKVVHIVRDPRTAVTSFMRQPWGTASYMLSSWFYSKLVRKTAPYVGRIHEVRLEDLLRDPEHEMRRILEFVGEEWDDAVLDHAHHAPLDDVPPMPWFLPATRRLEKPVEKKVELSPAWIRMVEDENEWAMERFGYGRMELEREPGYVACVAAYVRDLLRAVRFGARFLRGIRKYDSKQSMTAAQGQRFFFNLNRKAWKLYGGNKLPDPPDWRRDDPRVWRGKDTRDVVLEPRKASDATHGSAPARDQRPASNA